MLTKILHIPSGEFVVFAAGGGFGTTWYENSRYSLELHLSPDAFITNCVVDFFNRVGVTVSPEEFTTVII